MNLPKKWQYMGMADGVQTSNLCVLMNVKAMKYEESCLYEARGLNSDTKKNTKSK